jgi:translation initiation factor IF-2
MGKVRVGQLAKELNIKVSEVIARLKELGIEAKSNLSTVEDIVATRLRSEFAGAAGAAKGAKPGPPKVPKVLTIKKPGAPVPPGVTLPTTPLLSRLWPRPPSRQPRRRNRSRRRLERRRRSRVPRFRAPSRA